MKLGVFIFATDEAMNPAELARAAEDRGFESIWFPEHAHVPTSRETPYPLAADGTLSLRGVSKPVTLTFTWTPGAQPVLTGKATVKRLDFGVGGGDWADTSTIPNEVAISTKVVLKPKP